MMVIRTSGIGLDNLRRTVSFPFPREGEPAMPEELRLAEVGETVTLVVTGRIAGYSADEEGECLRLEVTAVSLPEGPGTKSTLGEMLRKLKNRKNEA